MSYRYLCFKSIISVVKGKKSTFSDEHSNNGLFRNVYSQTFVIVFLMTKTTSIILFLNHLETHPHVCYK